VSGINLLPWRAERRKQQQKEFGIWTVIALLLTAAGMTLVHFQIEGMIAYQNLRNSFMKSELGQIEQRIKEIDELEARKAKLISKMEVIQKLQSSRPEIVHLFDELARTLPEGVQLIDLSQGADGVLIINGLAQSNARVSAYMRNIEASPWFDDPVLTVIESKTENSKDKPDARGSKFTLQVKQSGDQKDRDSKKPA
jgi:type IV pilus assembly protein PilN